MQLPKRVRNHVNPLANQEETIFRGFADNKSIIMDIGAYRGEFSQSLVDRFGKEYNFIVCEIRKPYVAYLKDLFVNDTNVVVFGSDAARNISNLLQSSTEKGVEIAYIFINFPDPWFKEKHNKRRVLNADFLTQLEKLISSQTQIIFQTDQKTLFDDTLEMVQRAGKWHIENFSKPLWGITSYWEDMKNLEGSSMYRTKISLTARPTQHADRSRTSIK